MQSSLQKCVAGVLLWLSLSAGSAIGQTFSGPAASLLVEDSFLIDDCPICGRPTIQVPMRGTFTLRTLQEGPFISRFAMDDISLTASPYTITGSGSFTISGEVAVSQQMILQVRIDNGFTNKLCYFTNIFTGDRPWPMLDILLRQANGTASQLYTLRLAVAPVRELWFSTGVGFTSAPGQSISDGDLLSFAGRVVKPNLAMLGVLGVNVPAGLDAVDIQPGGDIVFSIERDAYSEILSGPLHHGDVLSTKRGVLRRNEDLLAPFIPQPPATDVGLDALQVLDSGEILFSIETNLFSERLGITLQRGDLLSSTGQVRRSNRELLARFHPSDTSKDYGLDAFYLWPHGEIWFSTEEGFSDLALGGIRAGDLLSDAGYIVFRNLELLNAFSPREDLVDFGLDALFIVTDAAPPAPAPAFTSIRTFSSGISIRLAWQGMGRVFQVERAETLPGIFQPISPVFPDFSFDDVHTVTNRPQAYYRLRTW